MSLQQRINDDIKNAMRAGDPFKAGTLRLLNAAIHNREIEKKGKGQEPTLIEEELIEVLGREAKKRKEAAEVYARGNRPDLAEKEKKELELISEYLPAQLDDAEIEKIISEAIDKIKPQGPKDFGRVMAEAVGHLKGRADTRRVSEIIKQKLGN